MREALCVGALLRSARWCAQDCCSPGLVDWAVPSRVIGGGEEEEGAVAAGAGARGLLGVGRRTPRIRRPAGGGWGFLLASDKGTVTSSARGKTPLRIVSVS